MSATRTPAMRQAAARQQTSREVTPAQLQDERTEAERQRALTPGPSPTGRGGREVEAGKQPAPSKVEAVKQPTARPQTPAPVQQKEPAQARPAPTPFSKIALASGMDLLFCQVPAGEFLMGSDKSKDSLVSNDELPQHKVYLDEYWIGKSSITVAPLCRQDTHGVINRAIGTGIYSARPTTR